MLKKLVIFFLGLYIVLSLMYFGHKIFPTLEKYLTVLTAKKEIPSLENIKEHKKISAGSCAGYAFGHIAEQEFRIFTRLDAEKEDLLIDEQDLYNTIAKKTCDKSGVQALIMYDSQPVSVASVANYDYSKPFAAKSEQKPVLYTVLRAKNNIKSHPESGFVIALYNFDRTDVDKYSTHTSPLTRADEDLINGHNDTIFFENTKKDVNDISVEYETIKTDINNDRHDDLIVLTTWSGKFLPRGVSYISIFILTGSAGGELMRYDVLPFTAIRKSKFFLFQIVDLNGDGRKEIVVRKNREEVDSFLVYQYDASSNKYYLDPLFL